MIAGCGCPILASVILSITPSFALWKSPPASVSVADDITLRMILLTVCIVPLGVGVAMRGLVRSAEGEVSVKRPQTLLRDLGSDPYEASLYMCSIISLATQQRVALGFVDA